jgi:hypothetical protein
MPLGGKFPYTKAGIKAAKKSVAAKRKKKKSKK